MRICLAGYDTEHTMPDSWECYHWSSQGGYGNQGDNSRGADNAHRERLWFSKFCIKPKKESVLFEI